MRLFHVSDVHFGREDAAAVAWFDALVAAEKPDAVIMTGDLTMRARRREFAQGSRWLQGLGVPVTEPSLGLLIANGYQYMLSGKYWISFYPGIALLITIVSINLVGDQLRDVLNPKLRR